MKKQITVKQVDTRVYLCAVDIPTLKPLLRLADIQLKQNIDFRTKHTPKYYIEANDFFKFIQTARTSFIVKII